jgi:non-canonical purine NTP pyrophosphatase (RdgB/HAM1 family)
MSDITLVTGNPNKLVELQALLPSELDIKARKLDLVEIQSLDLVEIVTKKLYAAYEIVGGPVIVEDISAELENLNGLPGPFIKFFEEKLGKDALYKLSNDGTHVVIRCCMGYYDGNMLETFLGIMEGTITSPKGEGGFGFDCVIIPDGFSDTLSILGPDVKNTISHRFKAAKQLAEFVVSLNKPQ